MTRLIFLYIYLANKIQNTSALKKKMKKDPPNIYESLGTEK